MENVVARQTKLSGISSSVCYCRHTGIKISMSTHFNNVSSLKLVAEHPVFSASRDKLEDMIKRSEHYRLTTTEQYLCCIAYLVKCKLVDTTHQSLLIDGNEFVSSSLIVYVRKLIHPMHRHLVEGKKLAHEDDHADLPTYAVNRDNYESAKQLKEYLKIVTQKLEDAYFTTSSGVFYKTLATEEEMLLRQELVRIDNGYNDMLPTILIRKKFVSLATGQIPKQQLDTIRNALFTKDYNKFQVEVLKQMQDYIVAMVECHNENDKKIRTMVIRYLDHMITTIEDTCPMSTFELEVIITPPKKVKTISDGSSALSALGKFRQVTIDTTKRKQVTST